ncbi:MAG: leucine-rich repeat domain-containing protein [Peptococcaceae bacterium]|nr:leucine-rich repeat domain-containing protein [Peptococcaceae bacterium]
MSNNIKKYEPLWEAWHIDSCVGSGSFGKVYKIFREDSDQKSYAAAKIVSIPYDDSEIQQMREAGFDDTGLLEFSQMMVKNMIHEINLTNDIGDDHIATYNDISIHERSDGLTLDVLLHLDWRQNLPAHIAENPITDADVVKLGMHICQALALCQQQEAVHLNIKPENIFVSSDGQYMLGDLGIARPLEADMSALAKRGVYTYMAPEVFMGEAFDCRADIYALGLVMYSLLNRNRAPFQPRSLLPNDVDKALHKRIGGEPIPDLKHVHPELNDLIQKACAFKPEDRFADPEEMLTALEAAAAAIEEVGALPLSMDTAALISDQEQNPKPKVVKPKMFLLVRKALIAQLAALAGLIKGKERMLFRLTLGLLGAATIMFGYFLAVHYFSRPADKPAAAVSSPAPDPEFGPDSTVDVPAADEAFPENKAAKQDIPLTLATPLTPQVLRIDISRQNLNSTSLSSMINDEEIPPDVVELSLSGNRIVSVASLQSLTSLTDLDLSGNSILDISPLRFLTELTRLNLNHNSIYVLPSGISSLAALRDLDLSSNGIADLGPLQSFSSLEYLNLNNNRVTDLSPLQSLTNLQSLHLDSNFISNIAALHKLTNLTELHLEGNIFVTTAQIKAFKNAVPGCTVYVNSEADEDDDGDED